MRAPSISLVAPAYVAKTLQSLRGCEPMREGGLRIDSYAEFFGPDLERDVGTLIRQRTSRAEAWPR